MRRREWVSVLRRARASQARAAAPRLRGQSLWGSHIEQRRQRRPQRRQGSQAIDGAIRNSVVSANEMWGGRFANGPAALMEEINASIDFDKRLAREDIAG